jgi:transposase
VQTAVFYFPKVAHLARAYDIDWQAIQAFTTQDMIQCLQGDKPYLSAVEMRGPCYHAIKVLHVENRSVVPYSLIAKVFRVSKSTVCEQYRAHAAFPASNRCPAVLSDPDGDNLVHCINSEYLEYNPWTMTEIKARIESVYHNSIETNTVRHIFHRDLRVKACRGT